MFVDSRPPSRLESNLHGFKTKSLKFEREIISERTRDKMSAARRKGKWVGGLPVLGYDVAPGGGRLIVNAEEAARVRAIYHLYLDHKALIPVVI